MKKICLFLAIVMLFLSLASCSSGLAVPEETKPEEKVTAVKKTEEKETEPILQEYDPAEDDVINVLMIGSSSCYYYVDWATVCKTRPTATCGILTKRRFAARQSLPWYFL